IFYHFSFHHPSSTNFYTLSLHDALPIYTTAALAYGHVVIPEWAVAYARAWNNYVHETYLRKSPRFKAMALIPMQDPPSAVAELRSEEHTSELQSLRHLVCRLLLEKKKET